jgi:hypothetical protein
MYSPDGSVAKIVLSSKDTDEYTKICRKPRLPWWRRKRPQNETAVTIADAVAIGGAKR